jgi:predicted enzyme related to lactoylglutathione lyase
MALTIVIDCLDPDALVQFWAAALDYQPIDIPGLEDYRVLVAEKGAGGTRPAGAPVVALQRVPEPRTGKNRVHLDAHIGDLWAHAARLEALGGKRLGDPVTDLVDVVGTWWIVMADPEGNELCLVADAATQPAPSSA